MVRGCQTMDSIDTEPGMNMAILSPYLGRTGRMEV